MKKILITLFVSTLSINVALACGGLESGMKPDQISELLKSMSAQLASQEAEFAQSEQHQWNGINIVKGLEGDCGGIEVEAKVESRFEKDGETCTQTAQVRYRVFQGQPYISLSEVDSYCY